MIIDRLLQFIDYEGINKSQFYKEVGLSNGFLDRRKDIGVSKLQKIIKTYPQLSETWLLRGEDPMILKKSKKPPENNMNSYLVDVQRKLIQRLEEENERLKKQIKRGNGYQIAAEPDS